MKIREARRPPAAATAKTLGLHGARGPLAAATAALAVLLLAGCVGKPAPVMTDYTLSYAPPAFEGLSPLAVELNVELQGANDLLSNTDMLYQQKPFSLNAYTYDRWAASPVTLVGQSLLRDMRRSGLFQGVFSYRENLQARYLLTGTLEEFFEVDGGQQGRGRLRLAASLLDLGAGGGQQTLLFQRSYAAEGPEGSQDAGSLAASLSQAMRQVSAELIADVHRALAGTRQ